MCHNLGKKQKTCHNEHNLAAALTMEIENMRIFIVLIYTSRDQYYTVSVEMMACSGFLKSDISILQEKKKY